RPIPAPGKDDQSQSLMVFYLAKGAPDTCGQGCNEWIAADGFIDVAATQRLRAPLARLRGTKPPIFFQLEWRLSGPGDGDRRTHPRARRDRGCVADGAGRVRHSR